MRPAIEIKVPVENVNDVTARLLHWRAESGATVKEGDLLAEMETTKAVLTLQAGRGGVAKERLNQCFASFFRLQPKSARSALQFYRLREQANRGSAH